MNPVIPTSNSQAKRFGLPVPAYQITARGALLYRARAIAMAKFAMDQIGKPFNPRPELLKLKTRAEWQVIQDDQWRKAARQALGMDETRFGVPRCSRNVGN